MHFYTELVRTSVPPFWKQNGSGWITGNCPVCVMNGERRPDTKKRGGFHFDGDDWVYHCFNCGFKTGWKPGSKIGQKNKFLLRNLNVDDSIIQRAVIELMREEETMQFLRPQLAEKTFEPDWLPMELPEGWQFLSDLETAPDPVAESLQYMDNRGLMHWNDWAFDQTMLTNRKRIYLPYRHEGKVVGYSARYARDEVPANMPKYVVKKPAHYIFNLDNQHNRKRKYLLIFEGDFDAITMQGVSLGTNTVTDEQAYLIKKFDKQAIVVPDADEPGNKLIEPAIKHGWHVSFPEWMEEFKDASEASTKYGRPYVLQSIIDAATDNPTKIRILAGKYLK